MPIIYFSRDILMSVVDESATLKKLKFSSWMTATIQGLNATVMRYSLDMRGLFPQRCVELQPFFFKHKKYFFRDTSGLSK